MRSPVNKFVQKNANGECTIRIVRIVFIKEEENMLRHGYDSHGTIRTDEMEVYEWWCTNGSVRFVQMKKWRANGEIRMVRTCLYDSYTSVRFVLGFRRRRFRRGTLNLDGF